MIIQKIKGKIECYDDDTGNKLVFNDLNQIKNFIENMSAKFDRFMEEVDGFENRRWFGFYTTFDNKFTNEGFELMKKYEKNINLEIKELGMY